jgi:hypothetical protein
MTSKALFLPVALSLCLAACGSSVRETRSLNYPGNSVSAAEALSAAIQRRGYTPVCKPREYCKFQYAEQVTLHFKIRPGRVLLQVDVEGGKEMPPADLRRLVAQMTALGEEIWNEAMPVALAEEEVIRQQEAAARAEWERQQAEAARIEAERQRAEAERLEREWQEAARVVYPEVAYVPGGRGAAFHFVMPERVVCQVEGDTSWTAPRQIEIPFQIPALRDVYYTFDCQMPLGVVWHQKVQAKDGYVATVRLYQGAPPPQPVPQPEPVIGPPPPPVPQPGPQTITRPHPRHGATSAAMDATSFAGLTAAVEKETFSADKLRPIQIAATGSWFTSAQVAALMDLLTFSADKVKVVEIVRSRIVDKGNAHLILGKLTFSADKEAVTKLLTQ